MDDHFAHYWFRYIIGGILAFSWIIFSMHTQADAQVMQDQNARITQYQQDLQEINDKLDKLAIQVNTIEVLTRKLQ